MSENRSGEAPTLSGYKEKLCAPGQVETATQRLEAIFRGGKLEEKYELPDGEKLVIKVWDYEISTLYFVMHRHNSKKNGFGEGIGSNYEEVESCYVVTDDTDGRMLSCVDYDLDAERALLAEMQDFYLSEPSGQEKEVQKAVFQQAFAQLQTEKERTLIGHALIMDATERQARDLNELLRAVVKR